MCPVSMPPGLLPFSMNTALTGQTSQAGFNPGLYPSQPAQNSQTGFSSLTTHKVTPTQLMQSYLLNQQILLWQSLLTGLTSFSPTDMCPVSMPPGLLPFSMNTAPTGQTSQAGFNPGLFPFQPAQNSQTEIVTMAEQEEEEDGDLQQRLIEVNKAISNLRAKQTELLQQATEQRRGENGAEGARCAAEIEVSKQDFGSKVECWTRGGGGRGGYWVDSGGKGGGGSGEGRGEKSGNGGRVWRGEGRRERRRGRSGERGEDGGGGGGGGGGCGGG